MENCPFSDKMTMGKAKEALPRQKSPFVCRRFHASHDTKGEREEENKLSTAPPSSLFPSKRHFSLPKIPFSKTFFHENERNTPFVHPFFTEWG